MRALAACLLVASSAVAADPPATGTPVPALAGCDELMREILRDTKIPGGALAVTKGGRLVYARGFGLADGTTPVEPTSRFRVASVSKPITAAAVLKLADAGKLGLDDKVFPLLRLDPYPGQRLDPRWHDVTVRHLLTHRGGFDRAQSGDPMFMPFRAAEAAGFDPPPGPRAVIRFVMGRPLDFAPGERTAYSNVGYCVLGRVIEAVTGDGYEEHVRKSLLRPLGLRHVRLGHTLPADRLPGEVAYHSLARPTGPSVFAADNREPVPAPYGSWYLEAMDAHGGWVASPVELARFLAALGDPGRFPAVKGKAVQAEFGPGYGFEGYLDGASAVVKWMKDGDITFAAAFNGTAGIGNGIKTPAARVAEELPKRLRDVTDWPAGDLFEALLK